MLAEDPAVKQYRSLRNVLAVAGLAAVHQLAIGQSPSVVAGTKSAPFQTRASAAEQARPHGQQNPDAGRAALTCPGGVGRGTDYNNNGIDSVCDPDEPVVIDPKGAPNRPGGYSPGYADGTYSYLYVGNSYSGFGSGFVQAFGRKASAHGSTGGGFALMDASVEFEGEGPTRWISGSLSGWSKATDEIGTPVSGQIFVGVWLRFTVLRPLYYRYFRSSAGIGGLQALQTNGNFDSKRLPPGEYQISISAAAVYPPAANFSGSYRLDFLEADPCPADLTADGLVDDTDFSQFVQSYNELIVPPASPLSDFNGDQLVDDGDFSIFVVAYDRLVCS